ncbi:hypothetical protein BOX15_Mlig016750g1, partial [Macrostomum lignano]
DSSTDSSSENEKPPAKKPAAATPAAAAKTPKKTPVKKQESSSSDSSSEDEKPPAKKPAAATPPAKTPKKTPVKKQDSSSSDSSDDEQPPPKKIALTNNANKKSPVSEKLPNGKHNVPKATHCLLLSNLDPSITRKDLSNFLDDKDIARLDAGLVSAPIAMICFESKSDADAAASKCQNASLKNRQFSINTLSGPVDHLQVLLGDGAPKVSAPMTNDFSQKDKSREELRGQARSVILLNVPADAEESDVRAAFPGGSRYNVKTRPGSDTGVCFVDFDSEADCSAGFDEFRGVGQFGGREVAVAFVAPRPERKSFGGGGGGGPGSDNPPSKTVGVFNLPYSATVEQLWEYFPKAQDLFIPKAMMAAAADLLSSRLTRLIAPARLSTLD